MIAINDLVPFGVLSYVSPPQPELELTSDVINLHLTASAIINTTITTAVKTMLLSILGNTNVSKATRSKIAYYTGFSVNTTSTIIFTSANVSLDKLTFYVIFKLPYTNTALTYEDIDNGSTISTIQTSPTAWGKYANYIRSLTGSGIKKINSAGEQVNNSGIPVNDSNESLEGWHNEKAYTFLGENPFNGTYTIPSGCYTAQNERLMLFGQNEDTPNGANPILDITKIPLYFYLLAKVENPYSNSFWLNSNKNSPLISRIPHWPSGISTKKYRRHFVKKTTSSPGITIPNGIYNLVKESNNIYFIVNTSNPNTATKIYIEPISTNSISYEGLILGEADKVEKTDDGLIAIWETKYDYPIMVNNSGLTIGMGVDMGATFSGFYSIKFDIDFNGSGSFRLYSGGRRSNVINNNGLTCGSLKTIITNLINVSSDKITVKDANSLTIGVPNKITILRSNDSNDYAYNHKIYAYDLTGGLIVTFTPSEEDDRWENNTSVLKDSWFYLNKLLNYSFSNNPNTDDYWLDQLGLSVSEKDVLKKLLKKCLGCRSKSSYHIWDENKVIFKKLEIKSYVRNLRATYHKFFIPRFYNLKRPLSDGTLLFNGTQGKDSVEYLLNSSKLKTKPNQAELFAIVLLNYNYPAKYRSNLSSLIDAINQHSISKLKATMSGLSKDRKVALNNFISATVKSKLYHGIDD